MLAALLVLLGTTLVVAPTARATSAPAVSAPTLHHELADWLRLSGVVRHAVPTVTPDSWWAVYTRPSATVPLPGAVSVGAGALGRVVAVPATSRSSRAPPVTR